MRLEPKEDLVPVFGTVEEPTGCEVSKRVMTRPAGILPDPLCFRRLEGPDKLVGEGGLDKFRGVSAADVFDDMAEGTVNGLGEDVIGKLGLKLCCNPVKSVVENDCLNIFGPIN